MQQQPPPSERLLGRDERCGDLAQAAAWTAGRRVLVTGAAGSVGWPLAHVLHRAGPAALVLLDHHEHSLFSLERSLAPAAAGLSYELLDVRHEGGLRRLFERWRPEVVIHLAAAKHVPYGERFPGNVVENNVLATSVLLKLARDFGTDTLIYPSSDKSVAPPSLYGATKRLCEALVQAAAEDRRWVVARYVNIIGTRGSVIETFTSQIQAGLPLTVTDQRMTRYWISMEEAEWLVLQAGRFAPPGALVMPECGEAVPVLETAQRLAAWYSPDRQPYPITISGMRPGERLHEVLHSANERPDPTEIPGVTLVRTARDPRLLASLPEVLERLTLRVASGDADGVAAAAMDAARTLQ